MFIFFCAFGTSGTRDCCWVSARHRASGSVHSLTLNAGGISVPATEHLTAYRERCACSRRRGRNGCRLAVARSRHGAEQCTFSSPYRDIGVRPAEETTYVGRMFFVANIEHVASARFATLSICMGS
jgi:hypothetical protein